MKDIGFIYDSEIFKVEIKEKKILTMFYIRQIRFDEKPDKFDGELWSFDPDINGKFNGKTALEVFLKIKDKIDSKYKFSYDVFRANGNKIKLED